MYICATSGVNIISNIAICNSIFSEGKNDRFVLNANGQFHI